MQLDFFIIDGDFVDEDALPRIHLVSKWTGLTIFGWLDSQYPAQPGAYKEAD